MKKLILILIMVLMALPVYSEEIDLLSLSTEELLSLKNQINAILIDRTDLWKEIRVPSGVWKVGVHIPSGHWMIRFDDPECGYNLFVEVGEQCAETAFGTRIIGEHETYLLSNKSKTTFSSSICEIDLVLTDGQYISIDRDAVVFSPYGAIRDLGFDW